MKVSPFVLATFLMLTACSLPPARPVSHGGGHGGSPASAGSTRNIGEFLPGSGSNVDLLPAAKPSETTTVKDGDVISLTATLVKGSINGKSFAMYGYNGQIPGPTLKAEKGSTFTVDVTNDIDLPTTIHWHGLRLTNASDGVPGSTQPQIQPGETYRYTVSVPDEGLFWYHPHVREDIAAAMGLYANILVESPTAPPSPPQEFLMIGDMLLDEQGLPVPFGKTQANHTMMGRFGNTMLVNGRSSYELDVSKGSVVRFNLTNVASARPFRLSFPGARMKLVGGDSGPYARQRFVDEILLSPSERVVADVYFEKPGTYSLEHRSAGEKTYALGTVNVSEASSDGAFGDAFDALIETSILPDGLNLQEYRAKEPDKTLRISDGGVGHGMTDLEDGIEWEDSMPEQNATSNNDSIQWKLVDDDTGKANENIEWRFKKGEYVKIRIINGDESMQHPIHFHGQRFLILTENYDTLPKDLSWEDTALLKGGGRMDLLVEMSNAGEWMFQCHIAEHLQNGMMGMFTVQ